MRRLSAALISPEAWSLTRSFVFSSISLSLSSLYVFPRLSQITRRTLRSLPLPAEYQSCSCVAVDAKDKYLGVNLAITPTFSFVELTLMPFREPVSFFFLLLVELTDIDYVTMNLGCFW